MTTLEVIKAINTPTSKGFYPATVNVPGKNQTFEGIDLPMYPQTATRFFCERLEHEQNPKAVKTTWDIIENFATEITITER